ncbi:MAG: DUF427 domain-containing protein [Chloroflexi bacterium]|nr:DUF427 domain-containing protein [Chloroflexota bacterium]
MANQVWQFEPTHRWIRTSLAGVIVADSKRAMLMIESRGELDYYFPIEDVRVDLLQPSDHVETSGYRGTRRFWHLKLDDHFIENAAWTYDQHEGRPDLTKHIAFRWNAMDQWCEEEEEAFLHPRNPHHRVDTLPSSRHVEVIVDGVKVADTMRPYLLFETGLRTRYYIPEQDLDEEHLLPSLTHSVCPYKGTASYYSVAVDGDELPDAAWYYPDPIPESPKLKGLVAFWPEKHKGRIQILVDGQPA